MASGETGKKLGDMIKKAIRDCEVTNTEFEEIMSIANEDGVIDSQEQSQLKELQSLISNGTVKRVPG